MMIIDVKIQNGSPVILENKYVLWNDDIKAVCNLKGIAPKSIYQQAIITGKYRKKISDDRTANKLITFISDRFKIIESIICYLMVFLGLFVDVYMFSINILCLSSYIMMRYADGINFKTNKNFYKLDVVYITTLFVLSLLTHLVILVAWLGLVIIYTLFRAYCDYKNTLREHAKLFYFEKSSIW